MKIYTLVLVLCMLSICAASTVSAEEFTGTTTTILTGLSGNQSISVPNGSQYDLNITNNVPVTDAYGNDKFIEFTVDHTKISGVHQDVPLALFINMPTGVATDGANVRIYYQNGTEIPREIESYNETSDDLMVWYKPSTTTDASASTYQIWYGNTSATEPAADSTYGSQNVWNSNYVGVWHMNKDPSGSAPQLTDSTRNNNDGTSGGSMTSGDLVDADYGKKTQFDANDYYDCGDSDELDGMDAITIETKARFNSLSSPSAVHPLVIKHPGVTSTSSYLFRMVNGDYSFAVTNSGDTQTFLTVSSAYSINTDYHSVARWNGTYLQGFIDGSEIGTPVSHTGTMASETQPVQLAKYTSEYLNGDMQEVRISNVSRSDDYILTTYNNMDNPTATGGNAFYSSIGTEQTASASFDITASVTGDSYTQSYASGQERNFTLIPTGTTNYVNITTNCTNYDTTVKTYWTEDIVVYTETVTNGYANYSISYTPTSTITTGEVNATYSLITFSEHDYVGSVTATFNGTPISATRNGQTVSIGVTNLNTSTHSFFISIPYNPQPAMIGPDGDTFSFSFPPLNHDVPANWYSTTGQYRYTVTTQGGVFVAQGNVSTNSTTFILPAGDYYWWIQGYDDVFDEYSGASTVYNFTVENDYGILNTTAIVGVVYTQDGQTKSPITNAIVSISNNTWSDSVVVGADGFYSFLDLAGNETYYLAASAEYYDDSGTITVTTVTSNVTQRDILLSPTTTDYVPHYVKFTVMDIFRNKYSDVTVSVYKGATAEGVAFRTGTTGDDGSATFRLDQNTQYTLTFVSVSQGINEEITLYPKEDHYTVYVITKTLAPDDQYSSDEIEVSVTKSTINSSHAYINVTYLDNLGETTALSINLNQSDTGNITDQRLIDSYYSVDTSNASISFIVEDYAGQSYFLNIEATHDTFDSVKRTYGISFDGMSDAHGFGSIYIWMGIGAIMFSGAIFKATNARQGAFVVCCIAACVTWLGWFDNLGSTAVLAIKAGTTLGFVVALSALLAKGEKEN